MIDFKKYLEPNRKGFINAFCMLLNPESVNLNKNFVLVLDGGSCFFQLKYDPTTEIFFDASINGEA